MEKAKGRGNGRIILFNEHFVVYGVPAIASSINRFVEAEVTPNTHLEIAREIHKCRDKPVIFTNVKGSDIPLVANICANRRLLSIGLGIDEENILKTLQAYHISMA